MTDSLDPTPDTYLGVTLGPKLTGLLHVVRLEPGRRLIWLSETTAPFGDWVGVATIYDVDASIGWIVAPTADAAALEAALRVWVAKHRDTLEGFWDGRLAFAEDLIAALAA